MADYPILEVLSQNLELLSNRADDISTPAEEGDTFSKIMTEDVELMYHYGVPCIIYDLGIHWPKGSPADHRTVVRKESARYTCTHAAWTGMISAGTGPLKWADGYRRRR